jgi:ABC-type nickel/cobalt efflux system permease component RcnA
MAAYLVGARGTVRDGLLIGLTVAVTHTAGVLVLGLVLTASQTFAPESVYPWLGLASGVTFVVLGVTLLVGALRRRAGVTRAGVPLGHHHHTHDHVHQHHVHQHHAHQHLAHQHLAHQHLAHQHLAHEHASDEPDPPLVSRHRLLTLGFAGGLVPTPTAVVVLLGATAIGRAWFGVALVLAYGIGMAATLVAAGLLLARARRRLELRAGTRRVMRYAALVPIATAAVVTGSGLWLVARAAISV